jgi:dihydroxyacetone kinase-like predicted kinase
VLRDWLGRALPALEAARERIDAVNVFPVPDGDTGTNVLLTVRGAADELAGLDAAADGDAVLRALARGALLAARGNSGVILSRYLGGLAGAAPGSAAGAAAGAAPGTLPEALTAAAGAARSAVPEPEDGTVLTVAVAVASAARDAAEAGADEAAALAAGVAAGRADRARISAAHPVLRSAHVVDAGGCALLVLLDALAGALAGRDEPVDVGWLAEHAAPGAADAAAADAAAADAAPAGQPARAAYEVVAVLRPADAAAVADALTRALGAVGDAVAVVPGDGVVTAHVHAAAPGDVAAALTASGAAWTATVRALLAGARDVVACTGSAAAAAAFADLGAVAVLLPGGLPAGAARDAVRRAAQDAGTGPAGAPRPVTVLPGGRLAPGDLDPAWTVPDGAVDDGTVLAALAAVPAVPSAGAEARP